MALPEDAWLNCFLSTPPRPLLTSLERRLHASNTHLNVLADVYRERAAIEATYAASLNKLAKTAESGGLSGKNGNEWEKNSGEQKLWLSVLTEISETSTSHSTLSAILKTDYEQPLREMPTKIIPWRRVTEQEASLDKTLKAYEKTSTKLTKAKGGKADALSAELDSLTASLTSLSPMVYTTFQRVDEARLSGLKEVVVRWGTMRADMAARDGEKAERSVAALLGWETQDEVLEVGRKLGGVSGARGNAIPPSLNNANHNTPTSNRRQSIVTTPSQSNNGNDFSPRPMPRQNSSSGTPGSQAPSSFGGGIKSMLGRTKSTLGGATGRGRSGSEATSTRSGRRETNGFDPVGEEEGTRLDGVIAEPPVDSEGFSVAPSDRHRNPWEDPNELVPTPAHPTTASPSASVDNISSSASSQHQAPRLNLALAPLPIQESEAEREAALRKMQTTLQMPPSQPTRRTTIARGRRDVRNTMFGGLPGLETLGNVAEPSGIRNTESPTEMGSSAPVDMFTPTTTNGDSRAMGRQDSGVSNGSTNPFDSPSIGNGTTSANAFASSALATSGEPGLRASMTETINVVMKNSEIQRVQLNGEIHVSLRVSPDAQQGPIHLRLSAFEQLEKVAPNPAFLAQVPDRPGEYLLNSEVLASATQASGAGSKKGTLLFRYQVHVPVGSEAAAVPLMLSPAFLCKDGETRMILNYKVNPESLLYRQLGSVDLTNVSFVAGFAGSEPAVTNVQAKPLGGVWSPVTRKMTWKLGELQGLEGKIVARFVTEAGEGEMRPVGVDATWGLEGVLASGLGVEVVDSQGSVRVFEEIKKGLTAGKYSAEPTVQ
ncbi:hypothetical protein P7C73_g1218, partial [Tremellales sp. Uapishka_1]